MKLSKQVFCVLSLVCLALVFSACSDGSDDFSQNVIESFGVEMNGRNLLAVYDAVINPDAGTVNITSVARGGTYHYPLTGLYPNVLTITGYGFTPNFWADIRLSHPLPGSGIDAFDARVIAMLPANPGVSMDYQVMNVHANNSVLLQPDGYTKLWDNPDHVGNTNPFVAYFKEEPYRIWRSSGTTYETKRWEMDLAGFGGPLVFNLIVDVSTNYPSPPQSVTDNAHEPVQISADTGTGLTPEGGSASVEVTLLDWQGQDGIGDVIIEAPDLFSGVRYLSYDGAGPNPNEYLYRGPISNDLHAPEGDYNLLVVIWDESTMVFNYNEFTITVEDGRFWDVNRVGDSIEIVYGSGSDFPQYAVLILDSGYFRMNYGPQSVWGTSVIVVPSFWTSDPIYYYQGELNDLMSYDWNTEGSDLLISFDADISSLHASGTIRISPPGQDSLTAIINVDVTGDVDLHYRPGETYKPVMLSSMHISENEWDTQLAYVTSYSYEIPVEGWIINPPVEDIFFGLQGGTSDWKTNAPTTEVTLDRTMQITGWVTDSSDPNDDNVGFWAASDHIIRSYRYTVIVKP